MSAFTVRPVRRNDLSALAALEQRIWRPLATPALSENDFRAWHEEDSPYFLLAEDEAGVCAYTFARQIRFSYTPADIAAFHRIGEHGVSTYPHDPNGNSIYGISIASERKGAGGALIRYRHEALEANRVPFIIGFSRLAGFASYLQSAEEAIKGLPDDPNAIALWYAHECARRSSMRSWGRCRAQPQVALPPVPTPDPVLGFHARHTRYGILDVVPGYLPDPESRNYGVSILSGYPHR